MSRKLVLTLGVIVLLAAAGAGWYFLSDTTADPAPAAAATTSFEIKPADRTLGNPRAKVVLIEYAAVTCPICAAFNAQVFPLVKKNYIDTGKVFYVFRMFPRMPEDGAGEKMARCLPKDKYFSLIDLLFRNQSKWDPEFGVLDTHGGLVLVGRIAGMTPDRIDACIADKRDEDRINQVAAEGGPRYNITGTPTFVINGVAQPSGGLPYEALSRLLDRAAKP